MTAPWNSVPGLGSHRPSEGWWVLGEALHAGALTADQAATILLRFVTLPEPWQSWLETAATGTTYWNHGGIRGIAFAAPLPDPPVNQCPPGQDVHAWYMARTAADIEALGRFEAARNLCTAIGDVWCPGTNHAAHKLSAHVPLTVSGDQMRAAIAAAQEGWGVCPECAGSRRSRRLGWDEGCAGCGETGQVRAASIALLTATGAPVTVEHEQAPADMDAPTPVVEEAA